MIKFKLLTLTLILIIIVKCEMFSQNGNWHVVDSINSKISLSTYFVSIDCVDTLNCVAAGNYSWYMPSVFSTYDGGNNWSVSLIDSISKGVIDPTVQAWEIAYPDTSLCILTCEEGYYWLSRDKCKTWIRGKFNTEKYLLGISFVDKNYGGIISYGELFLTDDGGNNWNKVEFNIDIKYKPESFLWLHFLDTNNYFVMCWKDDLKSYLLFSDDKGKNWKFNGIIPDKNHKIYFLNREIGFAVGKRQLFSGSSKFRDIIYKTTNSGNNWEMKLDTLVKGQRGIDQIYFSDDRNGVTLGKWWDLWRTTDGGDSWFQDTSYYFEKFGDYAVDVALLGSTKKFLMVNELNGYVIKYSEDEIINVKDDTPPIQKGFRIYPNIISSGESLIIEMNIDIQGNYKFEIFNSIGSVIDSYEFYSSGDTYTIEYTPPAGIAIGQYYIRIIENELSVASKAFIVR